jgi:hypothetical protein
MPHIAPKRYAVCSCHVERPLEDDCWQRFATVQARRPGGFRIAALMRPPDQAAGEDETRWLERARSAAENGPLGHHTHFVSAGHARPAAPAPEHAERVRREAEWLRANGLAPGFFCGGGWYVDVEIAEVLAEFGYADCTATAFRPAYLPADASRLEASSPVWLSLPSGRRLLELPSTHSLGMAARASVARRLLDAVVHVYFHDTDLLSRRRRLALLATLELLGRRCRATDLDSLQQTVSRTDVTPFEAASGRDSPNQASNM